MENNPNNLKIGDRIMIEEAWEDEAGYYHPEIAQIMSIAEDGEMELTFPEASPDVQSHLATSDGYMAAEFTKEE